MTGYSVGIDVGDRSVGLAAVRHDESGVPVEVLAAVSHIHDGGIDQLSSGQSSAVSRLASAGSARRGRRRFRHRRRRLDQLDQLLESMGAPRVETDTYQAWEVRAQLSTGYMSDDATRLQALGVAIRHMARHRGWRNPWWGLPQLAEAPTPSTAFVTMLSKAAEIVDTSEVETLGQLGWAASRPDVAMRPRTGKDTLARATGRPVFSERIRQEDVLAELNTILDVQRVDDSTAAQLRELVFLQNRPHVPADRVGKDPFDQSPRATRASLAFQRFRVLAAVANLSGLSGNERAQVAERLLEWRDSKPPRWAEVAEWLGRGARSIRPPVIDDEILASAPTDRTSTRIEATFTARSSVGTWWRNASVDDREQLVEYLADATAVEIPDAVVQLLDELSDKDYGTLENFRNSLESGRAAYGQRTLTLLSDWLEAHNGDLHAARTHVFGTPQDWQPPADSLTDPIEHPTLQRINAIVRQFLSSAVMRWGIPERVVIEHVRGSFLGPTAYREFTNELKAATKRTAELDSELEKMGVRSPKRLDRLRYSAIQRQNGVCLYCGQGISFSTCEMDHIVPDARGGSNRTPNLAAVCRECNADKGVLPFAIWAKQTSRTGASLGEALARVNEWNRDQRPIGAWRRLTAEVGQRLKMTGYDTEDRFIESTAYGAREMRARVRRFLTDEAARLDVAPPEKVDVYAGAVTAQARAAGGVGDRLQLRGKNTKTRLDRRHHAIDAAVLTTLRHTAAQVLTERSARRASHSITGDDPDWKTFEGNDPQQVVQYRAWKRRIAALADLLAEIIQADRVAVVHPHRLRPSVSKVHRDGLDELVSLPAAEFTADDICRIPEARKRRAVLSDIANGVDLVEAVQRECGPQVDVFASRAASIAVRDGQTSIGETVHHARVFAWIGRQGHVTFGQVRVFAGEFPEIGFRRSGIDVLAAPLPDYSQAMLTASATVRSKIASGDAQPIGWLAAGDEIVLDPEKFTDGALGAFMSATPERRWVVTGLPMPDKVSLAPAYLAAEGLDDDTPLAVRKIVSDGRIMLAINVVLGSGATVIRRTATGSPRWRGQALPTSWNPLAVAQTMLAQ